MHPRRLSVASGTALKSFQRRHPWIQAAAILACWYITGVHAHTLRLRVQPGRAVGGEAFLEQPQVEILEGDGGDVDVLFEVNVFATTQLPSLLHLAL